MASPQILPPGTVVGGRYRVEAVLGQGGFGVVFRAMQLNLDRPVALKVLLPQAFTEEGLARFQREAAIVQRIDHPNVVRLLDFAQGGAGEAPFLVFELLNGRTLEQILRAEGPLSPARAARITSQVLKGLMEAHARGVVHRDIKPANVFISDFQGERDFVKIIDFGLAKGDGARTLTMQGTLVGTPAYFGPEQVIGGEVTFSADLFALGLTLAEMLTGKAVLGGMDVTQIVNELSGPAPITLPPEALSSTLGPVIHRATQKPPAHRYPSAAEMLAHLDAVVAFGIGAAGTVAPTQRSRERGSSPSYPGDLVAPLAPTGPMTAMPDLGAGAAPITSIAPVPVAMAHGPTPLPPAPPGMAPLPPAIPRVPPAPARRRRGGVPWLPIGAAALGLLLLAGGLVAAPMVLDRVRGDADRKTPPGRSSARGPSSATGPGGAGAPSFWLGTRAELEVMEVFANADAVVDFVGFCTDEARTRTGLCVVDGATFQLLWRRPLTFDLQTELHVGAAARSVGFVDPGGVLRLYDVSTGAEQGSVALGSRAERVCAMPELPGKIWVRLRGRSSLAVDVATRTSNEAARPPSCARSVTEQRCYRPDDDGDGCPVEVTEPRLGDVSVHSSYAEGATGVALGTRRTDSSVPMLVGFASSPRDRDDPRVRWVRPLAPGDGMGAVRGVFHLELLRGRAVTYYDHTSGKPHLIAVEAGSGRTLWDVPTTQVVSMRISPNRVYVQHGQGLDVHDVSNGRLLGSVGKPTE